MSRTKGNSTLRGKRRSEDYAGNDKGYSAYELRAAIVSLLAGAFRSLFVAFLVGRLTELC